jgi:hypothetical protein|tara:strand:+ start:69 stop:338 length:270 start_codon:yes stop_codon:yes gene_type:complete
MTVIKLKQMLVKEATYGSKFGHTDAELRDETDIKSDILDSWKGSDVAQADLESFLKMLYDDGNYDTMDDMGAMFSVLSRLAKDYLKQMR